MIEVILLALALSMDAFAVAVGLGSRKHPESRHLSLLAALYFGLFQGILPLFGYLGGQLILGHFTSLLNWVAFGMLMIIGLKMLHEAWLAEEQEVGYVSHRVMLMLAVATSLDALAAGFSLPLMAPSPWLSCVVIGLTTFACSWLGVQLGRKAGIHWQHKATFAGGCVLILIGIKMVL
jgi:putative Mn2+ efflux pump MntP